MRNISSIFFDLDGTLYNSAKMIAQTYQESFAKLKEKKKLEFKTPTQKDIIQMIGNPGKTIFSLLVPNQFHQFYEAFKSINTSMLHNKILNTRNLIMPGTQNLLQYLKEMKISSYIASNGSLSYISDVLSTYKLTDFFYTPITTLNYQNISVKADILEHYQLEAGIASENCIMVGDRFSDLEAAKARKIYFIGLKSGIGYNTNPTELQGADLLTENIHSLHDWLKNNLQ